MTRTYTILGMTCNGCKASVERLLNEIPEVIKATVHLENKEARIVIEKQLPIKILQKALQFSL